MRLPCSSQSFALQTATEGEGLQDDLGFSASQFFLAQQQTNGGIHTQEEQNKCTHELWHMNCRMLLMSADELKAYRVIIKLVLYNLE